MSKPDFEKMAYELWPQIIVAQTVIDGADVIERALQAAYGAGLERAAEISGVHVTQEDFCSNAEWAQGISQAIRAEKSQ